MNQVSISATPKLELHRQQFPALASKTYFNYGGQGPMPQAAMDAVTDAQNYIQRSGPFGAEVNAWITQEAEATRNAIANEVNAPPETITLTEDVTVGCNIAMWGIDWQKGDRLLLTDCEHPGIIATAEEISRRFGVEVSTCPVMATLNNDADIAASAIAQHLHPQTRLVVLSHILWNTGQVLPLDKIVEVCSRNDNSPVRILVDAAQSVGQLPLNLTELGADFYAFTGHKWLCGPAGVGGLYVKPEVRESLKPTFIGWRSIITSGAGKPVGWQPDGRRYEVATSAFGQYAGLRKAIAIHQQWGTAEQRYQQICQLGEYLWQRLTELPDIQCLRTTPPECGLVSFRVNNSNPSTSSKLVQFLETQAILTRTIVDPNCVRACVHYFTLKSEIDKLVAAIQQFCQM